MKLIKFNNKEEIVFIQELFRKANSSCNYCVLRNRDEIPDNIKNDIDILVDHKSLKDFLAIIYELTGKYNAKVIRRVSLFQYIGIYVYFNDGGMLLIDLFVGLSKRWSPYMNAQNVLNRRVLDGNVFTASIEDQVEIIIKKELLTYGRIREKYANFITLNCDIYSNINKRVFENKLHNTTVESYQNISEVRKDIINNVSLGKRVLYGALYIKSRATYYLTNLFGKTICLVVLIGPDGVGKTTTSELLQKKLIDKSYYNGAEVYHHRPEYLPQISSFVKKSMNKEKTPEYGTNQHSPARVLVYILYYALDFILLYPKLFLTKANNRILIFDRYYNDFFIQKSYDRLPSIVKKIVMYFIPKPDLLVYLQADPNVIFSRKNELTLSQTKRQNSVCLNMVKNYKNGVCVDANNKALDVSELIKAEIINLNKKDLV
jgi:thymidylate kinase